MPSRNGPVRPDIATFLAKRKPFALRFIDLDDPRDLAFVGQIDVLRHCSTLAHADCLARFAAEHMLRTELEQSLDRYLRGAL
jgi:hypothetical protein